MVRNPWTALIALAIVVGQTVLAWWFGKLGFTYWWLSLLAAYFICAFANHANYVIIHDATHNLILSRKTWNIWIAILASWGLALFEYIFQVPGNRIGSNEWSVPQLKVLQECITLVVFTVVASLFGAEVMRITASISSTRASWRHRMDDVVARAEAEVHTEVEE